MNKKRVITTTSSSPSIQLNKINDSPTTNHSIEEKQYFVSHTTQSLVHDDQSNMGVQPSINNTEQNINHPLNHPPFSPPGLSMMGGLPPPPGIHPFPPGDD